MPKTEPELNGDGRDEAAGTPSFRLPVSPQKKAAGTPVNRVMAMRPKPDLTELAREPDLMAAIRRDIKAMGIAGEEKPSVTIYMSGTSRLLNRPLSVLVQGDSSTGKSHLIAQVAELFPPEQVLRATRMTPQALYHLQDPIAHKFVVGGERCRVQDDAAADATAALRQLRSEGRITKQITEQDGGKFVTREVTVEGPIAFIESTTLAKAVIFPEDLNRGLIVKTDGSEEQNRRVMREMAKSYSTKAETVDRQRIIDRHHDFQRSLKYVDVRIPFVERLAEKMPATQAQSRRVFGQAVAMIEAVTLLHQHHRRLDSEGRLLATDADYGIARGLLIEPLRESIGLSDITEVMYRNLREKHKGEFDTNQAVKAASLVSKPTLLKHLGKLEGLGLLLCVAKGAGPNPTRWRWTGKPLDELVLPGVKEVCVKA